ncbi:MAG: serine protein kinase RIO [Promethearchaeota archaeon]
MEDKKIDRMIRHKIDKRRERNKDSSDLIYHDATINLHTRKVLFNLLNLGVIKKFIGQISSGKEANVYVGLGKNDDEIAIKIYRINSQTSKWMTNYIRGDPRYTHFRRKNSRNLIMTWAMKEYKNLQKATSANIPCPKPIFVRENILIMKFIGNDGTPAKKLTEVKIKKPLKHLKSILENIKILFNEAKLVHADLSPFNLLYHDDQVYFIDFAQSVLIDHPKTKDFLMRDIYNTLNYFSDVIPDYLDENKIFKYIVNDKHLSYLFPLREKLKRNKLFSSK